MTRVAVVGATGYAGRELLGLCKRHPGIESITAMSAREGGEAATLDARGEWTAVPLDLDALGRDHDVVFTCLPHTVGVPVAKAALDGPAAPLVVDLSADHRFADPAEFERVYSVTHPQPQLCDAARYGLTEHEREALQGARLVANPGCYPTATLLALLPLVHAGLVAEGSRVVVDAKSGVSGAGKSPSDVTLYGNVNETMRAYGVGNHRHSPEILSRLGGAAAPCKVSFVPHLAPMFRGMLATVYVDPAAGTGLSEAREALEAAYAGEPFVHVMGEQARTADVSGTNHCHLSVADVDGAVVVTSAIDNLVKGAAGQALQNMNAVLGFDETWGLL
ncbi:MAG: N-acetyl-gamma-glutamyl-phosphate reductase [Planctomycetota bacterium]